MRFKPKLPRIVLLDGTRIDLVKTVNELMVLVSKPNVFRKRLDPLWTERFAHVHRALVLVRDELNLAYQEPDPPIPMLLWCPFCQERHIDRGEFSKKPHHTHSCQECGGNWRPAIVDTVGVQFLPGHKDGRESE